MIRRNLKTNQVAKADSKKYHYIQDIWEEYARIFLVNNPDCFGRYRNKVHDAIIYRVEGRKVVQINSFSAFHKRIKEYFDRAKTAIIDGEAINMYGMVGKIAIRRCERDFRKKLAVDWGKSQKLMVLNPETGKKEYPRHWDEASQKMVVKRIYFTEPDWCRIGLHKTGRIKNETVYEFKPSSSNPPSLTGFEQQFIHALNTDPVLRYRYIYIPIGSRRVNKTA